MKLTRPPYGDRFGTAGYFWVHAGHRATAISHAIAVIRDASFCEQAALADDWVMREMVRPVGEWVVETLIQGAWVREYHEWEKATKIYFDGQCRRRGIPDPNWRGKLPGISVAASHIDRVRAQLTNFNAVLSNNILTTLDEHRRRINVAKHEDQHIATEGDYRALVHVVSEFWNELGPQEEFTLR